MKKHISVMVDEQITEKLKKQLDKAEVNFQQYLLGLIEEDLQIEKDIEGRIKIKKSKFLNSETERIVKKITKYANSKKQIKSCWLIDFLIEENISTPVKIFKERLFCLGYDVIEED